MREEVNTLSKALRRKNYVLDVSKLRSAQKALGSKTETETIHKALEIAASELALAQALQKLLYRGKGHVVDVFSTR